jgi:hypothetical protein
MEFSAICPNDGPVEVGLDCISTIIFRGLESMMVVFVCPQCGAEIRVGVQIQNMLAAAIDLDGVPDDRITRIAFDDVWGGSPMPHTDETASTGQQQRLERYCEYFRRQLASIDDVDEALAEIDSRLRP